MTTSRVLPAVGLELVNPVAHTRTVFRATAASTDGDHVEVEATYPPHSTPPPLHLHPHQEERFTVLSGQMRVVADGQERVLVAGDDLRVEAGTGHLMWNDGDEPAVVRWRTYPALRTDQMFCDLWSAASDNGFRPGAAQVLALVQRYTDEFQLC